MRIKNYTPFPMLCFESREVDDTPFDTVVVRTTLDLGKHRVLRLSQEQTPLAFKDEWLDLDQNKAITVYRSALPWPRADGLEARMEFRDPAETEAQMEVSHGG